MNVQAEDTMTRVVVGSNAGLAGSWFSRGLLFSITFTAGLGAEGLKIAHPHGVSVYQPLDDRGEVMAK